MQDCEPCGRAVLLGSQTLLLSTRAPLPNKASCFVSSFVYLDNSFLCVRQKPTLGPWKGSSFLKSFHLISQGSSPHLVCWESRQHMHMSWGQDHTPRAAPGPQSQGKNPEPLHPWAQSYWSSWHHTWRRYLIVCREATHGGTISNGQNSQLLVLCLLNREPGPQGEGLQAASCPLSFWK